jgi:glycogen(starch) synthase
VWVHRRRLRRIRGAGRLGWGGTAYRLALGASVWAAVRGLRVPFDVVEYPEWLAEGWLLALVGKIPTVAHLHGAAVESIRHTRMRENVDMRMVARLERLSVQRASAVTSPSAMLADKVAAAGWIERSMIRVIPLAIDWQRWADTPSASNTAQVVQFVGHLEPRKAPEVLIEAIAVLRREMSSVRAFFAGDYEREPNSGLPALAWSTTWNFEGCCFAGHVPRDELKDLYASCRVFAQPSLFENFSVAALEAMASGRAVVVTSASGLAGFVRDAGAGAVVPVGDPQALAEALKPFLRDPAYAAQVGERARHAVCCQLDPDRIAALREEAYGAAIGSFQRSSGARTFLARKRPSQ